MFYLHLVVRPVSIFIKDEETCRLAEELARLTGETVTDTVSVAIRERLERQREIAERLRAIREISKHLSERLGPGPSAVEHGDFLYDENGLPK